MGFYSELIEERLGDFVPEPWGFFALLSIPQDVGGLRLRCPLAHRETEAAELPRSRVPFLFFAGSDQAINSWRWIPVEFNTPQYGKHTQMRVGLLQLGVVTSVFDFATC